MDVVVRGPVKAPERLTPRGKKFHDYMYAVFIPRLVFSPVESREHMTLAYLMDDDEPQAHLIPSYIPADLLDFEKNYFLSHVWFNHIKDPSEEEKLWARHMFFYLAAHISIHLSTWIDETKARQLAIYFQFMNEDERMTFFSKALLYRATTLFLYSSKTSTRTAQDWDNDQLFHMCVLIEDLILHMST